MTRPRATRLSLPLWVTAVALALPAMRIEAAAQQVPPPAHVQPPAADAQTVSDFLKRCGEYVALHKKIESGLPRLPNDATPQQIDLGQQALSKGIVSARANAKAGDVFLPGAQTYLRHALQQVFSKPDGKQLRASILDENPIDAAVRINGPYPDAIPLSTMPPQILTALPKLPDELEYRFVGERLILFDHHAHIVVDYVDRALPRV